MMIGYGFIQMKLCGPGLVLSKDICWILHLHPSYVLAETYNDGLV